SREYRAKRTKEKTMRRDVIQNSGTTPAAAAATRAVLGPAGNKLKLVVSSIAAFTVVSSAAHATTITVDRTGAPLSGHCNLTDAVQAATTNAKVHNCPAGSSSGTDTIILAANATYQGYGKALHFPPGGGAVVIQGTLSNNAVSSTIITANYG